MSDIANNQQEEKKSRNPWTSAFALLTEGLLANYKNKVQIISEYELFKQPMRIDIVVIKLEKGVVIDNSVMRFFKTHNIVEFKGPKDKLSIEAFDKTMSYFYAYLSKERNNRKQKVKFNDITITIVSVKKPAKTLKILSEERKYKIVNTKTSGIYHIIGDQCTPLIQLVISSELPKDGKDTSLLWLRSFRDDLAVEEVNNILEQLEKLRHDSHLKDVAYFIFNTNQETLEEVKKMRISPSPKVKKIFDEWAIETGSADKWLRDGKREGVKEVFAFLKKGHSLAEAEKKFAYSR